MIILMFYRRPAPNFARSTVEPKSMRRPKGDIFWGGSTATQRLAPSDRAPPHRLRRLHIHDIPLRFEAMVRVHGNPHRRPCTSCPSRHDVSPVVTRKSPLLGGLLKRLLQMNFI